MSKETKVSVSSGNVFADLGLPNADEELAKVDLAFEISQIIEERGLTQNEGYIGEVRRESRKRSG